MQRLALPLVAGLLTSSLLAKAGVTASARPLIPPQVILEFAPEVPPATFLPLGGGRVALLDNDEKRVTLWRDRAEEASLPIRGGGFDPAKSTLVDLVAAPDGGFLVLDSQVGTVWQVDETGEVVGRFGLFVGAVSMARGADGRVYVRDGANACVTAFEGGKAVGSFPSDRATAPYGTADHRVPYLETKPGKPGAALGLLRFKGREALEATAVGRVMARGKLKLLFEEVVGVRGDDLYVIAASHLPGRDQGPRVVDLWVLGPGGEVRRRQRVPRLLNHCWDCGPQYRIGPDGALWFFHLEYSHDHGEAAGGHEAEGDDERARYRVLRMIPAGGGR